ncbi:MAG: hypothetical protein J1F35_06560 [Erysipelotrichales bacterium]|nr:hypothetical protein [Erysipelotrichales bacterium]
MIYSQDWFSNRNELGKYKFDTSNAIYNFSNQTVSSILYGARLKELYKDPRIIEIECEAINHLINTQNPVTVTIQNKDKSCYTDGKSIVISGEPLINLKERGLDIILGLTCHESSHIRFTDFFLSKESAKKSPCIKWIWNLIEDEVIEEMLQIEKPGLGNLLGPVKDYMFTVKDRPTFKDDIEIILFILFSIIRYPKNLDYINKTDLNRFENLFNDIYSIMKINNIFNIRIKEKCTEENYKAALEIYELIKHYIHENQDDLDLPNGSEDSASDENKSLEEVESDLNSKFDSDGEPNEEAFGNMNGTLLADSTAENNDKDFVRDQIKNLSKYPIKITDYDPTYQETDFDGARGFSPTSGLKMINYSARAFAAGKYATLKESCKSFIDTIKKIDIKSKEKSQSLSKEEFQRNGSLDPRLLASAYQNEKNVYQRFGIKHTREKKQKFTLLLTLDESGSMGSKQTRETVSKIALSFAEAFSNNPNIDLYVYGHSDYVVKYIDPSTKNFNMLGNRYQGYGQNEVEAYNTILKDVTKKSKNNILLVNITDSQYLSNYSEIENELNKWRKYKNSHIIQSLIVINDYFTNKDSNINNKIYGINKWIYIKDINNISETNTQIKKFVRFIQQKYDTLKK